MEWNELKLEIAEIFDKVYGLSFEQHKDAARRFRSKKAMELIDRLEIFMEKKINLVKKEEKNKYLLRKKKAKEVNLKRKELLNNERKRNNPFKRKGDNS